MEEWKEVYLKDVCDLIPGFAFKSKDFGSYCHKVVKIGDIQPPYINYTSMTGVDLSNYNKDKISKFVVKRGDFLLAMTGATIGKIGRYIYDDFAYVNQRVLMFKPHDNVVWNYIYYIVSSSIFSNFIFNHIDSETAQPNISATSVGKYSFKLPPLTIQQKIANILSSLDDKIEVNRRINEQLEELAQALFKSWFVDFEPFKDGEFVESELGMIPEGCTTISLSKMANYLNGLAMQKFRPLEGEDGLPVLKIKELGQEACNETSELCSPSLIDEKYIVDDGDVIFSWSGTLLVKIWCGGTCGLNQHLFKVTSEKYPKWFVYLWTKFHLDRFIRIAKDKAVTMGHIKRGELDTSYAIVLNDDKMKELDAIMSPIIEQFINNNIEIRKLTNLRDTLLPKLMSGEIDVNEVEI